MNLSNRKRRQAGVRKTSRGVWAAHSSASRRLLSLGLSVYGTRCTQQTGSRGFSSVPQLIPKVLRVPRRSGVLQHRSPESLSAASLACSSGEESLLFSSPDDLDENNHTKRRKIM